LRSQIRGLFSLEQQAELAASAFARPNRPVASNDMAQGRARDRRATLMILAGTQSKVTDIPLDGAATAQ
jgi:flagellar motor protein MotB